MGGLKVYGNPYSEGLSGNCAWQIAKPLVSDAFADADIILSHQCSASLQDEVLSRCHPAVWASGHIHESHGARLRDGTPFANAAILDERSNPTLPCIVVDVLQKNNEYRALHVLANPHIGLDSVSC